MILPRLFLAVSALAVTDLSLAACRNPLPDGSTCCRYVATVSGHAGDTPPSFPPPPPPSRTYNEIEGESYDSCVSRSRYSNYFVAQYYGCIVPASSEAGGPTILPVPPTLPGGIASRVIEDIFIRNPLFPGEIGLLPHCLTLTGSFSWVYNPTVTCPIDELPSIPPTADACTRSLEANGGLANPAACPAMPVLTRVGGEPCLRQKLAAIGVAYGGPTSTIRTVAYQRHLREVWFKNLEHRFVDDPAEYEACATRRAVVEAEMRRHQLVYEPALNSNHTQGRAFDISETTIAAVRRVTGNDPDELLNTASPGSPACTLTWGGVWRPLPDRVHFQLNVP